MKKSMKRTAIAGVAVLMAGASIAGGATVTAAAIDSGDTTPAPDNTIVVQQISQDADGKWFSCEQELGADSGVVVTGTGDVAGAASEAAGAAGIMVTASAALPMDGGAEPIPVEGPLPSDGDSLTGIAVAVSGEAGSFQTGAGDASGLPTPDEIRPGTTEECNALQGK